jgi:hypothetical protein
VPSVSTESYKETFASGAPSLFVRLIMAMHVEGRGGACNNASKGIQQRVDERARTRRRACKNTSKSVQEHVEGCGGAWRGVQ